jgi:hypothetical protein
LSRGPFFDSKDSGHIERWPLTQVTIVRSLKDDSTTARHVQERLGEKEVSRINAVDAKHRTRAFARNDRLTEECGVKGGFHALRSR